MVHGVRDGRAQDICSEEQLTLAQEITNPSRSNSEKNIAQNRHEEGVCHLYVYEALFTKRYGSPCLRPNFPFDSQARRLLGRLAGSALSELGE